jgi:hypothetical protein
VATFPALNPNARTFIPGQKAATPIGTLDGDELSVLHTNASTAYTLRLTFTGLSTADHFAIVSHYMNHGNFTPFDLDTNTTLLGSSITVPTNYLWTYVSAPQTDYSPGVVTTTVELEATPQWASTPGYVF